MAKAFDATAAAPPVPGEPSLKDRINGHALLRVPAAERRGHEYLEQYNDLLGLVLKYKMQTAEKVHGKGHFTDPEAAQKALYDRRRRTASFDDLAFMEAFVQAVKSYAPEHGTAFLTYFDRLYDRELVHVGQSEQQQRRAVTVSRDDARLMRRLVTTLKKSGKDVPDPDKPLPANYAAAFAAAFGADCTVERVQTLWRLYNVTTVSLSDDGAGEDADGQSRPLAEVLADETAAAPFASLEFADGFSACLNGFVELEQQEYPRLFMTNDILRPVKEPDGKTNAGQYEELLVRLEAVLFARVFWQPYMEFVLTTPPPLTNMERVVLAEPLRRLNDRSIADFKSVSPAAVSMQHKRYVGLLARYAQEWQDR